MNTSYEGSEHMHPSCRGEHALTNKRPATGSQARTRNSFASGTAAQQAQSIVTDLRSRDRWMKGFQAAAIHDRRINKTALALGNWLVLDHRCKPPHKCDASVEDIARSLGVSESTVKRYMKVLVTIGWITRKRGGSEDHAETSFCWPS
jgi:hypothetical protein